MTDTRTVDPAVETEAGDDLEDYECVVCPELAVARALLLPCQHTAGYCAKDRRAVARTMQFRFTANLPTPCGICGTTVEAISWGRM
jgi:hypothetical protein